MENKVWDESARVSWNRNSPPATTAAPHSATVPKIDAPTAMRLRQAGVSTLVAPRSGALSGWTGAASMSIILRAWDTTAEPSGVGGRRAQ